MSTLLTTTEVVKRLTADLDLGSSAGVLQDVTDLNLALINGQKVAFTYICRFTNGNNIGIRFGINSTGTGTLMVGSIQANSTTAFSGAAITALNTVIFAETAGSTTANVAIISGTFTATSNGTLKFQACNEGSGACVLNSGTAALYTVDLWNNDSTTVTDACTLTFVWALGTFSDTTRVWELRQNPLAPKCRTFAGGAATDRITSATTLLIGTTWSVYCRFNTTTEDATVRRFLNLFDGANDTFLVAITTGVIHFRATWTGGVAAWTIVSPSTGAPHDMLWTYDAGATTNDPLCWLDGSSVTVTRVTGPTGSWSPSAATIYLGNGSASNRCYNGSLLSVAVWPDLRTGADAVALHAGATAPPAIATPTFYYPLDAGESPEIELMARNDGTVTGTTVGTGPVVVTRIDPFVDLLTQPQPAETSAVTEDTTVVLTAPAAGPPTPNVSDSTAVTEFVNFDVCLPTQSDLTTVTDVPALDLLLFPVVSDVTAVTDGVGFDVCLPTSIDSTTVTDSATVAPPLLPASAADSTTPSESMGVNWVLAPLASDETALTELVELHFNPLLLDLFDATAATEGLQMAMPDPPRTVDLFDGVAVTDAVELATNLNFDVNDLILATDGVVMHFTQPPLEIDEGDDLGALAGVGGKLGSITVID